MKIYIILQILFLLCFLYKFDDLVFAFKTFKILCGLECVLVRTHKLKQLSRIGIEMAEKNGNDYVKESLKTEINKNLEIVFPKYNKLMQEIEESKSWYTFIYLIKYKKCRRLGNELFYRP